MAEPISPTMTVIEISEPGAPEVLKPAERPTPRPAAGEILIRVEAAGINRPDLLQRQGNYPPPPGASDIPGLEVAGTVAALGAGVTGWTVGDAVCALLAGGGYAEYAAVPAVQCLPVPTGLSMVEAAALPETLFTCWTNLVDGGHLGAGQTVLIHGGSSGIGTTGIQLAKLLGARVFTTAGSPEKCAACRGLGADLAINYKVEDFVKAVKDASGGRGVDVVLDMVGGDYVRRNIETLAPGGRHVSIASLGGTEATFPIFRVMQKRLVLTGSTLRARSPAEKGAIADSLYRTVWPAIAAGRLRPLIHATFPFAQAAYAHRALEAGDHIGKIVLTIH
ncbi:MAG: NAD(P)H-quinone oxidoreductase [Rhodospirillales bacterium]|nr:NAD(P)H-quinone oxidoreductase [Rhodospirillales bacterium]